MNKKNAVLMMILMICGSALNFAADIKISDNFDNARYDAVVTLFKEKNLTNDTTDKEDIFIVEQHRDMLEVQLKAEKAEVAALYAPGIFNMAGKSAAALAFAGGLASAAGALGASIILGRPENEGEAQFPTASGEHKFEWKTIPGATYFEMLKDRYGFSPKYSGNNRLSFYSASSSAIVGNIYLNSLPPIGRFLGQFGLYAPSVAISSLVLAGISKYLLNKAASYQDNIKRLEAEIKRDNDIIVVLKALQK